MANGKSRSVVCESCGKAFNREPWQIKRTKRQFCSTVCRRVPTEVKRQARQEYFRGYYAKHIEKIKQRSRKWTADNSEKSLARGKEWALKNRERSRAIKKKWSDANWEERKATIKEWKASNKSKLRIYSQNRRKLARSGGTKLSTDIASRLLVLQRGQCAICRISMTKYHLDHIVPIALGGPHVDENIQLLCPSCNLRKAKKHPVEFMQSLGKLL